MILVCKSCKASFLVSASIFSGGQRRVKCARCGKSWMADTPSKSKGSKKPKPVSQKPAADDAAPKQGEKPKEETIAVPHEETEEERLQKLSKAHFKKLILMGSGISVAVLLFASLLFVVLHNQIVHIWPSAQHIYISVGLVKPPEVDVLYLRKVRSIRRYQDGAMHLIVEGEIFNQGKKIHLVPTLTVEALGPDGKNIKSWRIEPVQATIKAGATISFSSAILSPRESVAEVNLRFINQKHAK